MAVLAPLFILSVVAVAPVRPMQELIFSEDYPSAILSENRGGPVGYQLIVSEEGVPTRCDITYSSGHDDLDRHTCSLFMSRARFSPAVDGSGKHVTGVFRSLINWAIPGLIMNNRPKPPITDLELTIVRMPPGIFAPAKAYVAFLLDSGGKILDCTPTLSTDARTAERKAIEQPIVKALGPTACANVVSTLKLKAVVDGQGKPIASVQTARVTFDLAAGH